MNSSGVLELIGINQQVDQNDFSDSVEVDVSIGGRKGDGEILGVALISRCSGTGSILKPGGNLIVLNADPAVSAGDTALAVAEWATVIGIFSVTTGDWLSDANGAACSKQLAIPFPPVDSLYFVWQHTDATSFNDVAADDEYLNLQVMWRNDWR